MFSFSSTQPAPISAGFAPPPAELSLDFLHYNTEGAAVEPTAIELIIAAETSGEVVRLENGTEALLVRDKIIGTSEAEESLQDVVAKLKSNTVLVVFGLGLGHTLRTLRTLTDATLIAYEPEPGIAKRVLELGQVTSGTFPWHLVSTPFRDSGQVWSKAIPQRLWSSPPAISNSSTRRLSPPPSSLRDMVQRTNITHVTYRNRARGWMEDIIANVELLAESSPFLALRGHFKNTPAFIVGAGPSLNKNIKALAEARKKGIVFSVNTSAQALGAAGIEPQVMACVESIDVSHLIEDLPFMDRVVRAFSMSGHPKTLRTGTGPLLPIYEALHEVASPIEKLTGYPGLPVCCSVSTIAFSLAQRLGCSPIVLVGQDLSYTDGQVYAQGTAYEASRVRIGKEHIELEWADAVKDTHARAGNTMHNRDPLAQVPAWGQAGEVYTGVAFSAIRAWLEQASITLKKDRPKLRLLNATEGGCHIPGFDEIGLQELLDTLPEKTHRAGGYRTSGSTRCPTVAHSSHCRVGRRICHLYPARWPHCTQNRTPCPARNQCRSTGKVQQGPPCLRQT